MVILKFIVKQYGLSMWTLLVWPSTEMNAGRL